MGAIVGSCANCLPVKPVRFYSFFLIPALGVCLVLFVLINSFNYCESNPPLESGSLSQAGNGTGTLGGILREKQQRDYGDDITQNNSLITFDVKNDNYTDVYNERLERAQTVCPNSKTGKVRRIMESENETLANCIIAKAGCTFWLGIFRFIKNETNGRVYKGPFDIPRHVIHYGYKSPEYSITQEGAAPDFLEQAYRFMFVRDPYSRIWSSWIDKFLLPDYWFAHGTAIARWNGHDQQAVQCPVNVSFVDFVTFITKDSSLSNTGKLNEHWAPYYTLCDPCLFRPHFIGKMESFDLDSRYVLAKANLSWVADKYLADEKDFSVVGQTATTRSFDSNRDVYGDGDHNYDNNKDGSIPKTPRSGDERTMRLDTRDKHSIREMMILIKYNLEDIYRPSQKMKSCVSQLFVAQRLWKAFMYNGYIPNDIPLDLTNADLDPEGWRMVITEAYSHWDKDATKRHLAQKSQKNKAKTTAYSHVPLRLLNRIKSLFAQDFVQFGYDSSPGYIFEGRT